MRLWRLLHMATMLALLCSSLAVPVAAHEEHEAQCDRLADAWGHLGLWDLELAPGQQADRILAFEGCPLEAGWRLLIRGDVTGTLNVTLTQADEELGSYIWNGTGGVETVTLQHSALVQITLRNDGATNATASLYFDQTCLCTVKGTFLVPGPVWMNAVAQAGAEVRFNITLVPSGLPSDASLPETITVQASLFDHPETAWSWNFHPKVDPACRDSPRWTRCFEFSFLAPTDGRQDLLVWLDHDSSEPWSLSMRPVIEVESVQGHGQDVPALHPVALGLLALAAALVARRR